jgi:lipopolysaccharide transport system permease protein
MTEMLKELIQHRELLWALTWRNIKIRYKQTAMGFLWAIFMPLLVVLSGVVVRVAMSSISGKPLQLADIASVSVKSLPWAFFVGALKFGVNSLVGNMNLVTKIYFPREIFPLSSMISQLFDFGIAIAALTIMLIFIKIGFSFYLLWVPVLLALLILLTIAFSFILSCANLFFRDVKYIVDVVLTFGIFFTPVFYSADMFGKWKKFLMLNPVAPILEGINRVVVLHQPPETLWLAYASIWAIGGLVLSWIIFKKAEPAFAENI